MRTLSTATLSGNGTRSVPYKADAIVDQVSGGVHIATLTGDGLEFIEGVREIPGIRRPRPEELKG